MYRYVKYASYIWRLSFNIDFNSSKWFTELNQAEPIVIDCPLHAQTVWIKNWYKFKYRKCDHSLQVWLVDKKLSQHEQSKAKTCAHIRKESRVSRLNTVWNKYSPILNYYHTKRTAKYVTALYGHKVEFLWSIIIYKLMKLDVVFTKFALIRFNFMHKTFIRTE